MFNITTEGSYTKAIIGSKAIISSYDLPIAVINKRSKAFYINLEAIERFYSNTTSKHVTKALRQLNDMLSSYIYDIIEYTDTTEHEVAELYDIQALIDKAITAPPSKRAECLRLANDKGNKHFFTVYTDNELINVFEGGL